MNKIPIFKGTLPEDEEAILHFFRIDSIHDLVARLCQVPEEDLWNLIREILLALRSKVADTKKETSCVKAIEYLYALVRFIEISRRFPSKSEQGGLLEELTSFPLREDRKIAEVVTLLQKASQSPENREAIRQLRERSRKIRDSKSPIKSDKDFLEDRDTEEED